MLNTTLLEQQNTRNDPNVHHREDGYINCGIFI